MFSTQLQIKLLLLVPVIIQIQENIASYNSIRPSIRLGAPANVANGEHISLKFYASVESANCAKNDLQLLLHNFFENLQRNLSTSSIWNAVTKKPIDCEINRYQMRKLNNLADYFQHSADTAGQFAQKAELFFEASKNESYLLLLKLRQVPSAQRFLPSIVKTQLTDYFAEMEFFHVTFSEIIDQALECIIDTLRSIERVFIHYADMQRDTLRIWNFNSDEWCYITYMDFLQKWSAQIFKCTTNNNLQVAYDVYATTETNTKYIMRQLEFRVQRLYNCFIFGQYKMHCRFIHKPEQDFEKMFTKLDELQQYFDIKIKRGRVTINRYSRRRRNQDDTNYYKKCIPYGFPYVQMISSLKTCFNFTN